LQAYFTPQIQKDIRPFISIFQSFSYFRFLFRKSIERQAFKDNIKNAMFYVAQL